MSEPTKEYPVEIAVPIEDKHFGFWDMTATWLGANACTGSWYTGGVIAALGLSGAIVSLLIANPIAYLVLALIGYMGYKVGTTTMGLARVSFGIRGSVLPSTLNTIQFVGWCAVNTFIAAISLSYLFQGMFGWAPYGEAGSTFGMVIGILLLSVMQIALTVIGGTRSIKIGERVASVLLIFLTLWMTIVVFKTFSWEQITAWRPPTDISMPFGRALDVLAAFTFGWVPAIAEFTRYARNKSTSTIAPVLGANVSLFWFALTGALGVIAATMITGVYDPNTSDPSSIMGSLGLGWVAFLVLVMATVTTNTINIYAAGMSTANIFPKIKTFTAIWVVAIIALIGSLVPLIVGSFLDSFMYFLDYIGATLTPLFAILIIEYFVLRKGRYDWSQSAKVGGDYWYSNGVNWTCIAVWVVGVVICLVMRALPMGDTFGAIYPTLVITAILYWIAQKATLNNAKLNESKIGRNL
ncbi:MAG: cytosine permease [Bacillota bacterium]